MKVLSILQPYASLVVHGYKKIETRSWNTKYRGELLIHASVSKKSMSLMDNYEFERHIHHNGKIVFPFGAIIGKVNLVAVEPTEVLHFTDSISDGYKTEWTIQEEFGGASELAFGDYSPNRFGWLLSNPILFNEPIPCKGQLGIWNYYPVEHLDELNITQHADLHYSI